MTPPPELVVRCTVRDAPRVAEALTARGWGSLWIDEPLAQSTDEDGYVLHEPPPDAPAVVHAYPTREGDAPAVPERVCGFAVERVLASDAADAGETDWSSAWRASHAERVELFGPWCLRPPWSAPAPGERAIVIEPGGAFGTGEHPTTRDSLRVLHPLLTPGASVLDLGTGSGVLAIAAVLWGAGEVVAVDCQEDAQEHVRANAALNGIAPDRIRVVVGDLGDPRALGARPRWDVVLCNVGAKEVLRALPLVRPVLARGGAVVASGVFAPSEAQVTERARSLGLAPLERREGEGWVTLAWRATG